MRPQSLVLLVATSCVVPEEHGVLRLAAIQPTRVSRAITQENPTGAPSAGGQAASNLGAGRKGAPRLENIRAGTTQVLMDAAGPGVIRHIWVTFQRREPSVLRNLILRMYWDDSDVPSVEVPWGDFFAMPHGELVQLSSALVHTGHPPGRSFNCFFEMPFASRARIEVTNDGERDTGAFYFQIDYERVHRLPPNAGRFHAVFRRQNPTVPKQDYLLLETEQGPGHVLGIVMGIRATADARWWGEGEVKCYMDGDRDLPTICGTGLEDYYLTAYGMGEYTTPYSGCPRYVQSKESPYRVVSLYRWHVLDPIRWQHRIKITVQQIGWNRGLYERQDDYSSVVYYYVPRPETGRPALPDREARSAGLRASAR